MRPLLVLAALASAPAFADSPPSASDLPLPAYVTDSGDRFLRRCNDDAVAAARDRDRHLRFCDRLYTRWQSEAAAALAFSGTRDVGTVSHPWLHDAPVRYPPPMPRAARPPPPPSPGR